MTIYKHYVINAIMKKAIEDIKTQEDLINTRKKS